MKKILIVVGHVICILIAIALFIISRPPKNQKEWIEHQVSEMTSFNQEMLPLDIKTNKLHERHNTLF